MDGQIKTTRRTFLGGTAAAATAAGLLHAMPAVAAEQPVSAGHEWPENGTLIPDDGWTLWVDRNAEWKDDKIFLPEDVRPGGPGDIAKLPVTAPTGGWSGLEDGAAGAIPVTLPGTVEQHFWGKFGSRPYTPDEYRYAADDPVPQNGAYLGVSWWHRKINLSAEMKGKRIFLHVRGAHLRAEVYLNRKLVGYSIMEELPFEADLTAAANPGGENWLAIRITNPFGRYDWVDGLNAQWGAVKLYRSHGFGGLDRGMTISAHPPIRVHDAWVLNGPESNSIRAFVTLEILDRMLDVKTNELIDCEVVDPATGKVLASGKIEIPVAWDQPRNTGSVDLKCPDAKLWDLNDSKLYHLRITTLISIFKKETDSRTIVFGFRKFAPEGLGKDALFRLNGKRVKIYTAISWGFWGLNGMWPTPELAEKEVTQAQKLGLNCLNFHRNLAKEDVLRAHDRLGVMRYMEPGAGKMAIGKPPAGPADTSGQSIAHSFAPETPKDAADKFAQRYMFVKCVEMVKAFRSHPSVIEYCLQNEIGADLKNPDTLAVLKAMRDEDPSRCIVLNDGFVAPPRKAAQAWYEPWNDKLHRSDEEEYGGWWNQHQGAGDQWYDEFYKSPKEFTYGAPPLKGIITEYGEMEGCATPDNHSLMLHQQADPARTGIGRQPANASYDHVDHAEILAAYDRFLDRWGFRKAFPATERLWLSLGKKCYDTWQNYMENARISSELDFCAISGWESTAIENHSGIVDNLRNFKSDPKPIAETLQPVRPVAKQRAICTERGKSAVFDLYLLNDTSKAVNGTLEFTVVTPSGKLLKLASLPVPKDQTADVFSYIVKEAFETPALKETGMYRFKFALSSMPAVTQTKEIWATAPYGLLDECKALRVGVSGISPSLRKQLESLGCVQVHDFKAGEIYGALISSGMRREVSDRQNSGDTTGLEAPGAFVPGVVQPTTEVGRIDPAILDAVRAGTPLLAIPQADSLSEGVAKQLAAAGAFEYHGTVGDFRAPWMGNWYFVREHPVYAGMPVNQAMGIHYQAKGRQSNGLLVDGPEVEIVAAYSRDHDRRIGAGTFTTKLGKGKVLYQRVPEMHPVLQQRFLANALRWLIA
jgi:beta-galactosidase